MDFKLIDYRDITIMVEAGMYMVQNWMNDEVVFYSEDEAKKFIDDMLKEEQAV